VGRYVRTIGAFAAGALLSACSLLTSLSDLGSSADGGGDAHLDVLASDALSDALDARGESSVTDASDAAIDAGSITFTASSGNTSSVASSVATVAKPTGTLPNDFVWVLVAVDESNVTITPPSGWNVATQVTDNTNGFVLVAYDFFAGVAEPATYNVGLSAAFDWSVSVATYRNVNASPFDVGASGVLLASAPFPLSSIATTVPNALMLAGVVAESGDGTWSITPPLTSRAQTDFILAADLLMPSPGMTGAQSVLYSTTSPGLVILAALSPK